MMTFDPRDPRFPLGALRPAQLRALFAERVRLLRLLPLIGRGPLAALLALITVTVLTGPAMALLTGELLDRIVQDDGLTRAAWVIAGLGGMLLLQQLIRPMSELVTTGATRRIDGVLRERIRQVALTPATISHLEESEFQDDALRASEIGEGWWVRSAGTAACSSVLLTGRVLSATASAVVLALYFPWLAGFLLAASLLSRSLQRRQWTHLVTVGDRLTGGQRRVDYLDELAAGLEAAKEIRLFGLADWLVIRRASTHWELRAPYWALRRSLLRRQGLTTALSAACGASALLVPGLAAADGNISAGALGSCLAAATGIFQITLMGFESFDIEYGKGAVQAVDRLFARYGDPDERPAETPTKNARTGAPESSGRHAPLIRFDQVTFRYPHATQPVLHEMNLTIHPGQVLAIVGVNGAGKTTLTKLLAGLYRPTHGRITVDDQTLGDLDPAVLRRRLSVIYQDFLHYPATVRDNITLSAPEDPPQSGDEEVLAALHRAGADGLLRSLAEGLDTQLWRTGSGGRDLSGGQWQRLALARVLYATAHGRDLIVLDEPTANLDAEAETEFFDKVVATVRLSGVSVVLISHRLSTVRNADRIVVLDDGRITESGSHDELLASPDGSYARLWRLQASRFTGEQNPETVTVDTAPHAE